MVRDGLRREHFNGDLKKGKGQDVQILGAGIFQEGGAGRARASHDFPQNSKGSEAEME